MKSPDAAKPGKDGSNARTDGKKQIRRKSLDRAVDKSFAKQKPAEDALRSANGSARPDDKTVDRRLRSKTVQVLHALQRKHDFLERLLQEKERALADRAADLVSMQASLAHERVSAGELVLRSGNTEARRAELEQTCARLEAERQASEKALKQHLTLTAELERVEADLAARTAQIESMKQALSRERAFNAGLLQRPSEFEFQLREMKEVCARYATLLSQERQRAAELDDELTSLRTQNANLLERLASARDRFLQERTKNDDQFQVILSLQEEATAVADAQRALGEEREKNELAKQRILSLEASVRLGLYESVELRNSAAKAENTSTEFKSLLTAFEHAVNAREAQLNSIFASTSWRVTAPWRVYKRSLSRLSRVLRGQWENPLFDRIWYLTQYSDVNTGEIDPFGHYLWHGVKEGRNPNSLFDTRWYLDKNPDVVSSGMNPLVHFYRYGAAEGRDPHPVFSIAWHLDRISRSEEHDTNPMVVFIGSLKKTSR
jgi:hypothetical protein